MKDNELLNESENITNQYNEAINKQKELDDLSIASRKFQDINDKLNSLQNELDFRINELEIELRNLNNNVENLNNKINQSNLLLQDKRKNLSGNKSELIELNKLNENYLDLSDKFSLEITEFKNKLVTLQTSNKDHENKLILLQEEHKTCPLCKSGLDDDARNSIVLDLNNKIQQKCMITDVGSTKLSAIKDFKNSCNNNSISFIPGHPIAGIEKSGPEYGFKELFQNRFCILTPLNENDLAIEPVKKMWQAFGMQIEFMKA